MKLKTLLIPVLAIALASLSMAQGQGRGGGMMGRGGASIAGRVSLLQRADVQEELKIDDDQKTKFGEMQANMRTKMQEMFQGGGAGGDQAAMRKSMEKMMGDMTKEAEAILKPEQKKRLYEIAIQMAGPKAAQDADVQKALELDKDQVSKLKELADKMTKANTGIMTKMRAGEIDRSEIQPMMEKNNKILDTEIEKILTTAQKAKLTEMGGKKFEKKDGQ